MYPRANGYVRAWKVDLGDKVKEGDVLAEIDTPELDQQLEQAQAELEKTRAALAQAEVSRDLAEVTFKRSSALEYSYDPKQDIRAELTSIEAELKRVEENQRRMPNVQDTIDQPERVRPRV